jgi:hypothetical protein
MVRRRSTVRFRNGAPQKQPARPGQKLAGQLSSYAADGSCSRIGRNLRDRLLPGRLSLADSQRLALGTVPAGRPAAGRECGIDSDAYLGSSSPLGPPTRCAPFPATQSGAAGSPWSSCSECLGVGREASARRRTGPWHVPVAASALAVAVRPAPGVPPLQGKPDHLPVLGLYAVKQAVSCQHCPVRISSPAGPGGEVGPGGQGVRVLGALDPLADGQ